MPLNHIKNTRIPATADFHVHLRDGAMMELVTPLIRSGGVDTVYVESWQVIIHLHRITCTKESPLLVSIESLFNIHALYQPNLTPPITTVQQALAYRKALSALDPNVTFLMSLYLHQSTTIETIIEAKQAGITGVKSYPAGVTTNSAAGVVDYSAYYPIFAEMERQDLILNLHGECPSDTSAASSTGGGSSEATTVLNAEARFLPVLLQLHTTFPRLRIILEHLTTAAAVDAVRRCGPTVVGTITAHHLHLTIDEWAGNPFHYCKPVAKLPTDRVALLQAATSGEPKFFFGSDSAPHPVQAKRGDKRGMVAAGVFTQPVTTQLVLQAFEEAINSGILVDEMVTRDVIVGFLSEHGRRFYDVESTRERLITIGNGDEQAVVIPEAIRNDIGDVEVVPFRAGEKTWSVRWDSRGQGRMGILF